jgi:glycosyltransferase 2 family protein
LTKIQLRRTAIKIIAVIAVFALIYFTIGGQWADISENIQKADKTLLALSFVLYGLALYIGCIRWHVLLKVQNVTISHWEVARLHYSGYFFNTTTPGAVGGDLLKIASVMKYSNRKIIAAMSIFIDRLIGLTALLIVALLCLIPAADFLQNNTHKEINLAVLIVALGAVAALLALFLWCIKAKLLKIKFISTGVNKIQNKFPRLSQAFSEIIQAGDLYQDKWRTCLGLMAISLIAHILLGMSFYMIGKALGLEVSPILFILSMQVSNALAAVFPLPGGIGLRDSIGKAFLLAAGTPAIMAATAPLLYSGVILAWGLIGALIFIHWRFTK